MATIPTIVVGSNGQRKVVEPVFLTGQGPDGQPKAVLVSADGSLASGGAPGRNYQSVNISSTDYAPTGGFKALHVVTAGDVVIQGDNGNNITFPALTVGLWPYGGAKVIKVGTTAVSIAIL